MQSNIHEYLWSHDAGKVCTKAILHKLTINMYIYYRYIESPGTRFFIPKDVLLVFSEETVLHSYRLGQLCWVGLSFRLIGSWEFCADDKTDVDLCTLYLKKNQLSTWLKWSIPPLTLQWVFYWVMQTDYTNNNLINFTCIKWQNVNFKDGNINN